MERTLALEEHTTETALEPLSSGYWNGLVAWSVLALLFTVIPGIIALVNCFGIRSSQTTQERQQKADAAFDWCLVGTMLGVIVLGLARIR